MTVTTYCYYEKACRTMHTAIVSHILNSEITKVQNNVKALWNYTLVPSLPPKKKILSVLAKDSLKIEIELFP